MTGLPTLDVAWHWWWVPGDDEPADVQAQWHTATAALVAGWLDGDDVGAGLPPELREGLTPQVVGEETATWLRSRAAGRPAWSRIAWGAAFLTPDRPLTSPVVAVVDMLEPTGDDASYLLATVGAEGLPDDARPPVVDYVTTAAGDGVRVAALVRTPDGELAARADAALRVDPTPTHGAFDVVLSTRVTEQVLFGVVGAGLEELVHLVAAEVGPDADVTAAPSRRSIP